ncbi:MAG: RNA methyltransferase [Chloroflexota bacterium]
MYPITSTTNTKVKLANALQSRARTRRKEGKIVLEGVRLIEDAWVNKIHPLFVLHTADAVDDLITRMREQGVGVFLVDERVMAHVTETHSPQGIVAVFPTPQAQLPSEPSRLLILDALQDPGNVGTLIRSAAGAGCDGAVLAPGSVDAYNPKVLRAGMGAHFRIPVAELNWDAIKALDISNIYLATGESKTTYDAVDWTKEWALIIGSEAHGASDDSHQFATTPVRIPMAHDTESLNAAMAATVMLFEAARQRRNLDN